MAKRRSGDLEQKIERTGLNLVPLSEGEGTASGPDLPSVIVFSAGDEMFGVDVNATEGVVDCPRVVPLPGSPHGVVGVTSVRGRITIVMDLAQDSSRGEKKRLILLRGEAQLGLLSDRVESVVGLEPGRVIGGQSGLRGEGVPPVAWPFTVQIRMNGREIPIIDVEKLSGF